MSNLSWAATVRLVGERLQGLTAVGRATIERLKINQTRIVTARRLWIRMGVHPPNFT